MFYVPDARFHVTNVPEIVVSQEKTIDRMWDSLLIYVPVPDVDSASSLCTAVFIRVWRLDQSWAEAIKTSVYCRVNQQSGVNAERTHSHAHKSLISVGLSGIFDLLKRRTNNIETLLWEQLITQVCQKLFRHLRNAISTVEFICQPLSFVWPPSSLSLKHF